MKVGTLVEHRKWGKGIVTEIHIMRPFVPVQVVWFNPRHPPWPHHNKPKVKTSAEWKQDLKILSTQQQ